MISASNTRRSFSVTRISSAAATTWLFVIMYPSAEIINPDPTAPRWRSSGMFSGFNSGAWPGFKRRSNSSSSRSSTGERDSTCRDVAISTIVGALISTSSAKSGSSWAFVIGPNRPQTTNVSKAFLSWRLHVCINSFIGFYRFLVINPVPVTYIRAERDHYEKHYFSTILWRQIAGNGALSLTGNTFIYRTYLLLVVRKLMINNQFKLND